jgi:ubiquinone/menaquinone biosynthesis C-methylase UbiE
MRRNYLPDRPENRTKRFFERVAPVYDIFAGSFLRAGIKKAAELLEPVAGLAVLDVCTGTGALALELAARGARVTGVDFSPAMLARGRRKAHRMQGAPAAFLLADAASLDFPPGSFDLCTISMALHEMPPARRRLVLANMRRAARDRLLVMDWVQKPRGRLSRAAVSLVERMEGGFYEDFIRRGLRRELAEAGLSVLASETAGQIGIFVCR